MARKASKRYQASAQLVEERKYPIAEAVELLQKFTAVKFDETIELATHLNTDPKKNDQQVRGTIQLPHGTGRTRRVVAFCKGENEAKAKEAGADFVGGEDLVKKIEAGWLDFDVAIATPDIMREVSRLGKILGPRNMMPNPKAGTVSVDIAKAVKDVKAGQVAFKSDKLANVQVSVGRRSFSREQLVDNIKAMLQAIVHVKPASVRGRLIKSVSLSSTMSPGIALNLDEIE
jgi:large subunit ribosomal protein L1